MLAVTAQDEEASDLLKEMLVLKPNLKVSNKAGENILHLAFQHNKPHVVLDILLKYVRALFRKKKN